MKLPILFFRFCQNIAPIDQSEAEELRDALNADYKDILNSLNSKKLNLNKHKNWIADNSKLETPLLSEDNPFPIEAITPKEKAMGFFDSVYVRCSLWIVYMVAVPAMKKYLRQLTFDEPTNDDRTSDLHQMVEILELQKKMKNV